MEFLNPVQVVVDGHTHSFKRGQTEELQGYNGSYKGQSLTFLDELSKLSDGYLYCLPPFATTRLVKLTAPGLVVVDRIADGHGWWVAMPPEPSDEVLIKTFDRSKPQDFISGTGWKICFVAGEEGLWVAEKCTPPFPTDGEIHVEKLSQRNFDHKRLDRRLTETIKGLAGLNSHFPVCGRYRT